MSDFKQGQKWLATAPSNIALIKYMGKTEHTGNRPTNTSLSYTLNHLRTFVELELNALEGGADRWEPLKKIGHGAIQLADVGAANPDAGVRPAAEFATLELSEKGLSRFLAHLSMLKAHFGFRGSFTVRSANDFPSDCGLASSASSFAALTRVALLALSGLTGQNQPSVQEAAEFSRRGSGSSCRSFFTPWSIWSADTARGVEGLKYSEFIHQVLIVNEKIKSVSSSEAHKRVATSLQFHGRPERAEMRVQALLEALRIGDWREAFEITWAEFWDMHALFESSRPSFGYMTSGSLEVLNFVRASTWEATGDGPLVTMDAGPNVHLMYRSGPEGELAAAKVAREFEGRYQVFSNLGETASEGSAR